MNEEKNLKSSTFNTAFSAFSEMYSSLWPHFERLSANDRKKVFIGVFRNRWREDASRHAFTSVNYAKSGYQNNFIRPN